MTDAEIRDEVEMRFKASSSPASLVEIQDACRYVTRAMRTRSCLSIKAALFEYLYSDDGENDTERELLSEDDSLTTAHEVLMELRSRRSRDERSSTEN